MDKQVAYIYNGIVLSHKKEWNLAICNNMDAQEGIMLSEIHQTEKDKCFMFSPVCWMNKYNKTETDTENKLMVARGEVGGWIGELGEGEQEVQTTSYKINESKGCNV